MAETCETMTVKRNGDRVLINKEDFNSKTDEKIKSGTVEEKSPTIQADEPSVKIESIVGAIKTLKRGNKDHFTNAGLPRDSAIETILGFPVSKEERSEAWNIVQVHEGTAGK